MGSAAQPFTAAGAGPAGPRGRHRPAQLQRRVADRHLTTHGNALIADGIKVGAAVLLNDGSTRRGNRVAQLARVPTGWC